MYALNIPSFMLRELPAAYRHEAVALRRQGISYDEILSRYSVAKSTLWRWLKTEGLVASQPHELTARRRAAQKLGAAAQRQKRLRITQTILDQAQAEIGAISTRELWLLGIALYWGEGAKEHPGTKPSAQVIFSNMDPRMLRVFLAWLIRCCDIDPADIVFEIYLHEHADGEMARQWWAEQLLSYPAVATCPIRWKRHNPSPRRSNVGADYHGLLRLYVRRSTNFNRQIAGWIQGITARVGE